ncbi:MAG: NRDE family protein [Gemmatimonadota bacterium]
MCLILLVHHVHPDYPLVLAANRDEFYTRPTAAAAFWDDAPHVLAGRDLAAGGSWLGVTRTGRWAALTNYRDPPTTRPGRLSRGALVGEFLRGDATPAEYVAAVAAEADDYEGFNLLVGDLDGAQYFGNRMPGDAAPRRLESGLYGLSNHLLDTAWPKVERGRRLLRELLDAGPPAPEALLEILFDTEIAPLHALPDTGVGPEWERVLSASFIATPGYGTRASTALIVDRARNATFVERTFLPGPIVAGEVRFDLVLATS